MTKEPEEIQMTGEREPIKEVSLRDHTHRGIVSPKINTNNLARGKETRIRYSLGTNQSISHNTATKLNINTKTYDDRGEFDTTNYRFIPNQEGYYLVIGNVRWAAGDDNGAEFSAYLYKNGSKISHDSRCSTNYQPISNQIIDLVYLDTDDYIELYCEQDSGDSINASAGSALTYLSIIKLFPK